MTPAEYAQAVVAVLREHTTFITSEAVAEVMWDAVVRQAGNPQDWFEVIVDSPARAIWKLRPVRGNPARVRLACFRVNPNLEDDQLEHAVNEALAALEAGR